MKYLAIDHFRIELTVNIDFTLFGFQDRDTDIEAAHHACQCPLIVRTRKLYRQ